MIALWHDDQNIIPGQIWLSDTEVREHTLKTQTILGPLLHLSGYGSAK